MPPACNRLRDDRACPRPGSTNYAVRSHFADLKSPSARGGTLALPRRSSGAPFAGLRCRTRRDGAARRPFLALLKPLGSTARGRSRSSRGVARALHGVSGTRGTRSLRRVGARSPVRRQLFAVPAKYLTNGGRPRRRPRHPLHQRNAAPGCQRRRMRAGLARGRPRPRVCAHQQAGATRVRLHDRSKALVGSWTAWRRARRRHGRHGPGDIRQPRGHRLPKQRVRLRALATDPHPVVAPAGDREHRLATVQLPQWPPPPPPGDGFGPGEGVEAGG